MWKTLTFYRKSVIKDPRLFLVISHISAFAEYTYKPKHHEELTRFRYFSSDLLLSSSWSADGI